MLVAFMRYRRKKSYKAALKTETISPTIIARTRRLESPIPAIERIPKTESTQRINRTPAISRSGVGRMLRAHETTSSINMSHNVMT